MINHSLMNQNEQYNELISYTLCESMYNCMYKFTNYTSFGNMCSNIKDYINSDFPITGELRLVIKSTVLDVSFLYGITEEETKQHLFDFLKRGAYLKYHKIVHTIKINCKNSYHI